MIKDEAILAFLALGQGTRLDAFRLLVTQGPKGLPVTEIADRLDVNISTLSRHLSQLERARLLRSWRVQRQIFYATDAGGIDALMTFVNEDCCAADPVGCNDQ